MKSLINKLGKFGMICIAIIVVVLVVSLYVDAKKKKNKQRQDAQSEWISYNDFINGNHEWGKSKKKNRKNRNDKNLSYGNDYRDYNSNRSNNDYKRDNQGSSVKNVTPVGTSLTDVRINGRYSNVIKRYAAMTVNFNSAFRVPNCVSYVLTSEMIDITSGPNAQNRRNYKFYADPSVSGCPEWYEYKGSGYDRGHMAPANDMRWSVQSMSDCFLMTNICPQDHDLNGGSWNKLELKVHAWAKRYGKIIVATGPIFDNANHRIGNNNDIVVPAGFFKVVLDPSLNRAIGFVYENHEGGGGVARHACSVDEVERITGHDFFGALPDNVENTIESTFNFDQWN